LIEEKLSVSSNGVIYAQSEQGVIPKLLSSWFAQRKEMRKAQPNYRILLFPFGIILTGIGLTLCHHYLGHYIAFGISCLVAVVWGFLILRFSTQKKEERVF
jgi:hypothetical protein